MFLYAFYLGGKAKNATLEVHDVCFCIGNEVEDCFEEIKRKWFGEQKKLHIDAFVRLEIADGYRLEVSSIAPDLDNLEVKKDLYFINLGGYINGVFSESHKSGLVVAGATLGAISRAKKVLEPKFEKIHGDNVVNLSKYFATQNIYLILTPSKEVNSPTNNCYMFVK